MHRGGHHAGLRAGVRPRLVPQVVDRHREQRHRDPLAGGEQHVELAARRQRADLVGQVEQLVGGVAHRGDHDDHVVAGLAGGDDALGHPLDPLGVGDGGTAVLLHHQCHVCPLPPSVDPSRADAAGLRPAAFVRCTQGIGCPVRPARVIPRSGLAALAEAACATRRITARGGTPARPSRLQNGSVHAHLRPAGPPTQPATAQRTPPRDRSAREPLPRHERAERILTYLDSEGEP